MKMTGQPPLYAQVRNAVLRNIKDGVFKEDERIPTEKELMESYGVGRATVREAISRLVAEGYLTIRHGTGTFVAKSRPALGFEPFISLSYSLKSRGIHLRSEVLQAQTLPMDDCLRELTRMNGTEEVFIVERIRRVSDSPLCWEQLYFSGAYAQVLAHANLTDALGHILAESGSQLRRVEQVLDRRPASETECQMLDGCENVLDMRRWTYDDGDTPFSYAHIRFPDNLYLMADF